MTKRRYPLSLLFSLLLYGGILWAVVQLSNRVLPPKKPRQSTEELMKIALINPPIQKPKATPLPVIPAVVPPLPSAPKVVKKPSKKVPKVQPKKHKPKHHKKPKRKTKRIKPKKPHKHKPHPKPKPISKPKVVPQAPLVTHERQVNTPIETPITTPVAPIPPKYQPTTSPIQPVHSTTPIKTLPQTKSATADLTALKKAFLNNVRNTIYTNKRYPTKAKRRHIQGRVHLTFTILANGEITDIQTQGGAHLLRKAARQSLLKSSPLSIPSKLLTQFPMRNIHINIDFKLQ